MKTEDRPETYPIAGPDWRGTLHVWRNENGKARRLTVLLPDGSEVPVTKDDIQDGDESFVLPLTEADLRRQGADEVVVPVIAEEVVVDRERVPTGKVRVQKHVDERTERVEMPLTREEVDVQRVPVNRVIESIPQVIDDGNLMVIPVVREEMIVTKRLVLQEEIRIRRIRTTEKVAQDVTVRSERAEVSHTDAAGNSIRKEPGREPGRTGRKYRFLKDW